MNAANVGLIKELLDKETSMLRSYLAELQASNNDENTTTGGNVNPNSSASTKEKVKTAS